jgi:hypothetical protein
MGLKHWQWKRVKPEQSEQRPLRRHGHVDEDVPVLTVEEKGSLDLKEI